MLRKLSGASLAISLMLGGVSAVWAESRPIKQLPGDVVRWSMVWTHIPEDMATVGYEDGPLAAVTWGPMKGTASMVHATTDELWSVLKPDTGHARPRRADDLHGVIVRYTF